MSVSTLDKPVPAPTTAHTPHDPKAAGHPPAPEVKAQQSTSISFPPKADKAGPVFGDQQPSPHRHVDHAHASNDARQGAMAPETRPQSFVAMVKQWLKNVFGGHRPPCWGNGAPPRPVPCNGAPPRPSPGIGRPHPKPDYTLQSNEQLTQALLDNFNAFTGKNHSVMTARDIRDMANKRPGNDPVMNNNIRLAKELLDRPDLMQALDRNSQTGAQDKRISMQDLRRALLDTNFFRYKFDKEVAQEVLGHFDELTRRFGGQIKINDLEKLAAQPLTGDSSKDHLIQLAQSVLKRSNLLGAMDTNNNGRISRRELERLLG